MENIVSIISRFYNEEKCILYLERLRWPHKVISPFDRASVVYNCLGHKYKCRNTNKYFSVKTGTIFEHTRVPLYKWFLAIHLYAISKKKISSVSLANELSVPQRTAYLLIKKIKNTLKIATGRELTDIDKILSEMVKPGAIRE